MIIKKAFSSLDTTNSGVIDIRDMKQKYNASGHPIVFDHRMTE
jgi:Ca2+-binding EF-hand superfamily protein